MGENEEVEQSTRVHDEDPGAADTREGDDTSGHMHPEEFPQGPIRPNDESMRNTPQS